MFKRIICGLLFISISTVAFSQSIKIASIVSENVDFYMETGPLGELHREIQLFLRNDTHRALQKEVLSGIQRFKKNTGIDLLDVHQMKRIGLDLSRNAAVSRNIGDDSEVLYLPVQRDDLFPFVVAALFKKVYQVSDNSWYPVVSPYMGHAVYQVGKNIFISAISGYCVISTRGETARDVIKWAVVGRGSFMETMNFNRYFLNGNNPFKVKIYMTRRFLSYKEKKKSLKKENKLLKKVSYEEVKKGSKKIKKGGMQNFAKIPSILIVSLFLSEGDLSAQVSYPSSKKGALSSQLMTSKMLWIKNHSHVFFSPLIGQYSQRTQGIPFQNHYFKETMNNLINVVGKKRMEYLVNKSYGSYEKIFFESKKGNSPSLYFIPLRKNISLKRLFKGYKRRYHGKMVYVKKKSRKRWYYIARMGGGVAVSRSWFLLKRAYGAKKGIPQSVLRNGHSKGDILFLKMKAQGVSAFLESIDKKLVFADRKGWVVIRGSLYNNSVRYSIDFHKKEPGK